MKRALLLGFLLSASGCHRRTSVTYFDFSARTDVPNGVDAGLETSDGKPLVDWGAFSGSSIVIASDYPMPDTVLIDWTEDGKKVYDQILLLRQLLPPIDPRREKYNAQFWFHPGGKVDVKVDAVPIGNCKDTEGFDGTSIPQYGPCSVTGKW
jgi:hypothetical protein